jgi:putative glutamine transport system substrate-binding protein
MNWHSQHLSLCLLLTALRLTACFGGSGTETAVTTSPTAQPLSPVPTPLPDDATTAARIRARGHLLVGVRYDLQPFGYITDDGQIAGFDVDLGRELARRWLGDTQAVQFRQVRFDTAIEHLQAGNVDIVIAALPHTQGWEAGADFSLPYFVDGQALLVRAADAAAIAGPMNLEGHPVGLVAWEETEEVLRAAVPFTLTLQPYDRFDAAVAALARDEVDAVADQRHRLFWGQRMLPETTIVGQYTEVPLAFAFPQNDPFFADLVNLTFQEIVADGTYAELYARWFPEPPPAVERWQGEQVPDRSAERSRRSLADAPLVTRVPDTIAVIQSRGRLTVALIPDRSPFAYIDVTGALAGYEISLVRLLAERWLGDPTAVDFIPVPVETGEEMLRTGQADLLVGALPHTCAAELELDFSLTTYVAGESLLAWAGTPISDGSAEPSPRSVTSLNGQQVAVVQGSGSREALLAAAQDAGVSLTVLPRPTLESAIALLTEERVVAVAGERTDLLLALSGVEGGPAYATPGLGVLPLRLTEIPLALGLPPGDSAFRDLVNMTLLAMKAEGQFDGLYAVWFDDVPPALEAWPGAPYRVLWLE